uniref:Uncharacterized protein n=1 Tax=Strigamia maritima TaxID=126957 RepID=T1IS43_STRMM
MADSDDAGVNVASAKIANAILASVANVASTALAIEKATMLREASADVASVKFANVILADAANAAMRVLATEPSPAANAKIANALKPKENAIVVIVATSAVAPMRKRKLRKVVAARSELLCLLQEV